MTSNKIMKIEDHKEAQTYRASCDCCDPECDMVLEIEVDKETSYVILNIYKKLRWASYWKTENLFHEFWLRIKTALKILFTGVVEVEESFLMRDKQIDDFVNAIKEGKNRLRKE